VTVHVIVNPVAGRGAGERLLPQIRSLFREFPGVEFTSTRVAGDEERLAEIAVSRGASDILVVGGDGTCSGAANAILAANATCRFGVIPCGTGNDFAKTLGVAAYEPEKVRNLMQNKTDSVIDVGFAEGRYFLNSCGFGFDPSVLEATQKVRLLKGDAVYVYSALRQLFSYRGIEVSANGVAGVEFGRMLMVTISNGRSLGGAFKIAPHASVLDGKLDACFFSDSNVVERASLFIGALRGTHLGMRAVSSASIEACNLTFARPPSMEMDGELRIARSTTVELKCVPRALSVVAAPGALV
jgi:YegS/Rv2252/BmrU family lipid kinase